jgi:Bax protein
VELSGQRRSDWSPSMARYPSPSLALTGIVSLLLLVGCSGAEETAPLSEREERQPLQKVDAPASPALLLPDIPGGKLVAVTVVDDRQLLYRLIEREQFNQLKDVGAAARLFFHLEVDSAAALEKVLKRLGGNESGLPNVSLASFPTDLQLLPVPRKKDAFFRSLLPLVVFHNEVSAARRRRLEQLRMETSSGSEDSLFLAEMCRYYRLDRQEMNLETPADTLTALLERVDQIPPSLALAQAAIESGWGGSRFSKEGNNLFGQRVWSADGGMAPKEVEKARFRLAVFATIGGSIRSYMRNLNSHPAYAEFRRLRRDMREGGGVLDPRVLTGGLQRYSTRGQEYVDDLIGFIEYNDLRRFDRAVLDAVRASN